MPTDLASWLSSTCVGRYDTLFTVIKNILEEIEEEKKPKKHLGFADYLEDKE